MSLNSVTIKKFLLTAGLLLVLGQGLWQLPELQDYLFPDTNVKLMLDFARKDCQKVEANLIMLNKRIEYLKWIQAHNDPDQKVSAGPPSAFRFSEFFRPLAPKYFWHMNVFLAHKNRTRVESILRHLDVSFKSLVGEDFRVGSSQAIPAIPAKTAAVSKSMKQIQQFQNQCIEYKPKLTELTKQLTWLENNDYKK